MEMAFCGKCGTQINDARFCPACGAEVASGQATHGSGAAQSNTQQNDFSETFKNMNNTADTTGQFEQSDIMQNKAMAILAYLGILVLIPIFAAPDSKFSRFHANQGLVLLIAEVAFSIVQSILHAIIFAISWRLSFILTIVSLLWFGFFVLIILGIMNAANGKAKELPVIGKFTLLK